MAGPTAYPELNAVLGGFVAGVQTILGASFCGAYLQGSFAVGDADEHSDVDFIVVTQDEVDAGQLAGLQALHRRLYALQSPWAQHLEGSYAPKDRFRRVDKSRSPFWFLDHGANELIRDNHCNLAVVRWALREHGITLAGPDPKSVVDPVSPDQLRSEALAKMLEYAEWAPVPTTVGGMSRWKQPYLVLTFCRMLHTIATGTVASKRVAGEWAIDSLDREWGDLIRRALDDRPDPSGRVYQQADPEDAARTLAFVDYAVESSARS